MGKIIFFNTSDFERYLRRLTLDCADVVIEKEDKDLLEFSFDELGISGKGFKKFLERFRSEVLGIEEWEAERGKKFFSHSPIKDSLDDFYLYSENLDSDLTYQIIQYQQKQISVLKSEIGDLKERFLAFEKKIKY